MRRRPIAAAYEPRLLFDPAEDAAAPAAPQPRSTEDLIKAYDPKYVEPEKPGQLESLARGAGQGLSLGFQDEIAGALESAFTAKPYTEARDESRAANKAAKDANPLTYGAGEIGGGLATLLIPGLNAAKGASVAAQVGKAAIGGALSGAGASEAEDVGGVVADAATGAGVAGLGAGLFGAIGAGVRKYVDTAPRRAVTNTTKDLAEGAIPTFQRRFATMKDLAFEELEPDKAFMKAAKGTPEKARDIAETNLRRYSAQTVPIYDKLDKVAGKVPLQDAVAHLDERIMKAAKDFGDSGRLGPALEEVRDELIAKATANKTEEISHKQLRQWVTGLLKTSFKKIGTIAETENAWLAAESHEVADEFLKKHLQKVGASFPDVADDLTKLSSLNRKIKAYASAESLMAHKEGREFWKQDGLSKIADGKLGKAATVAAVGGAIATGNPLMAGLAIAPMALQAGAQAVKSLDRKATAWLARVVLQARSGDVSKKTVTDAIKAGVPRATIAAALAAHRMTVPEDQLGAN